jgi:hypothetical protein
LLVLISRSSYRSSYSATRYIHVPKSWRWIIDVSIFSFSRVRPVQVQEPLKPCVTHKLLFRHFQASDWHSPCLSGCRTSPSLLTIYKKTTKFLTQCLCKEIEINYLTRCHIAWSWLWSLTLFITFNINHKNLDHGH